MRDKDCKMYTVIDVSFYYTRKLNETLNMRHVKKVKDLLNEIVTFKCEVKIDKKLLQRAIDFVSPHYTLNVNWEIEEKSKELFKDEIYFW